MFGTALSLKIDGILPRNISFLFRKFCFVLLAPLILPIEEVFFIREFFKKSRKVLEISKMSNQFKTLCNTDKIEVLKYYKIKKRELQRSQKLICRESSIQLVLQNVLIAYQVVKKIKSQFW